MRGNLSNAYTVVINPILGNEWQQNYGIKISKGNCHDFIQLFLVLQLLICSPITDPIIYHYQKNSNQHTIKIAFKYNKENDKKSAFGKIYSR